MPEETDQILQELTNSLNHLNSGDFYTAAETIRNAERVIVLGSGRTGQVGGMFAQRLNHLGIDAWWNRDLSRPSLTERDLLIVCSGSGETDSVIAAARSAREDGVPLLGLLGNPDSTLDNLVDNTLEIPGISNRPKQDRNQNSRREQAGNSLFEQCLLIVIDGLILHLQKELNIPAEEINRRHTNIE